MTIIQHPPKNLSFDQFSVFVLITKVAVGRFLIVYQRTTNRIGYDRKRIRKILNKGPTFSCRPTTYASINWPVSDSATLSIFSLENFSLCPKKMLGAGSKTSRSINKDCFQKNSNRVFQRENIRHDWAEQGG